MDIKIGNKILMTITADDIACMEHDVLSPRDWFKLGLRGKINACRKRWLSTWVPILRERGLDIPSSNSDLIALIKAQSDYKNRQEREEVSKDVADICLNSGKLVVANCPLDRREVQVLPEGTAPTENCDIH